MTVRSQTVSWRDRSTATSPLRLLSDGRDDFDPVRLPEAWLNLRTAGNVVTFVDTRYREAELGQLVAAQWGHFDRIDAEPMTLRGMFTALARAALLPEV